MNSQGLQVTTPTDTTIVLTRTFNAPRRLVWEAMTTPDKMRRWMLPPPGWTIAVCECDARVAGALRLVWQGAEAGQSMALHGVFTEAITHERMTHTEVMLLGTGEPIGSQVETHDFSERGGVTTMRITQVSSGLQQAPSPAWDRVAPSATRVSARNPLARRECAIDMRVSVV